MRISRTSRSFRLVLGSLAALLGVGATTQAVGASTAPAADDHTSTVDPTDFAPETTYESCQAMFGLSKSSSDLASFDVVQTGIPLSPAPAIGTDIHPIVTITDGTTSHECEAVPFWTDEATYLTNYISGDSWIVNGSMPYPGNGFYGIPTVDGATLTFDGTTPFTPTSRSIRFEHTLPSGHTVSAVPAQPLQLQSSFFPVLDIATTVADLASPFYVAVFDAVAGAGTQAQADYLEAALQNQLESNPPSCSDSDPELAALTATMQGLIDPFLWNTNNCGDLLNSSTVIGRLLVFDAETTLTGISVTVAGPEPTTTTTTTVAPEPIAPAFTG